jgi:hypothetical protein
MNTMDCLLPLEKPEFLFQGIGVAFPGAVLVQLGWKLWMYWTGWTKTAQYCRVNGYFGHHLRIRVLFFYIARFEVQVLGEELKTSFRSL